MSHPKLTNQVAEREKAKTGLCLVHGFRRFNNDGFIGCCCCCQFKRSAGALYWVLLACLQKEVAHEDYESQYDIVPQKVLIFHTVETPRHQRVLLRTVSCFLGCSSSFGIYLVLEGWQLAATTLSAQKQEEAPLPSSLLTTGTRVGSPGSSQR